MKKRARELIRLQNIIENDRLSIGKGFEDLFLNDLSKLLNDYFEIKQKPILSVEKIGGAFNVTVCFESSSIKSVKFLPE